ncbi:hypothetical protein KAR48_16910 [bacterium]|nr:hypothetical protein [bacterium]
MNTWQLTDLKHIWRDGSLRMLLFAPLLIMGVFGLGFPVLGNWLNTRYGIDWNLYRPFIAGFAAMLIPMLFGFMMTFILVDERDEGLIEYFRVTPLAAKGYLAHRLGMTWILGSIGSCLALALLWPGDYPIFWLIMTSALLGTQGMLFTLLISTWASNKVEALAIGKAAGLALVFPAIAYFVDSPLRFLAAPIPHFWAGVIFRQISNNSDILLPMLIAWILHSGTTALLIKKFMKRID